jgi:aminoglycoside/choline kinase family phosphotransferase
VEEASLLTGWYMPQIFGKPVAAATAQEYRDLWRMALRGIREVPETLVLRDYHVDNLMRLDGRAGIAACGILDFQDAVRGPATYDLVSLVEDARRDIAPSLAAAVRARYLAAFPDLDRAAFDRSMAVLGAQRHAKVIGIFTRLCVRDGKPDYLPHIPRVWRLLEGACAHPALSAIRAWLDAHIPPADRIVPPCEAAR